MFKSLIESSSQRDLKIKQVKRNESVIMFLTINFGLTTLPNEIFKTILFFDYEMINSNGIYFLLNFFELFLILFNFISFLINFKKLRHLMYKICFLSSKKKSVNLVIDEFVPMETHL